MKKIIIILVILVGVGGFFLLSSKKQTQTETVSPKQQTTSPQITSTKPDPLDNAIVSATEPIEISFNYPLQNTGEFKNKIDPKIDYKVELSSDRKTAKITFNKPLELGISYTLSIGPDTKFDGIGAWGQSRDFHFRTVTYKGI